LLDALERRDHSRVGRRCQPASGGKPPRAAVGSGLSLNAHAESAGIAIGTARWHLKRVLEKLGARSQPDLVHLLLTGPATGEKSVTVT